MEDFAVNFVMEKGLHARSIKHRLAPFTLVGATTRPGMLSAPLRERFGIFHHLDFYSETELARIVTRSADILESPVDAAGGRGVARRGPRTPPLVNRLPRPRRGPPPPPPPPPEVHARGGPSPPPSGPRA